MDFIIPFLFFLKRKNGAGSVPNYCTGIVIAKAMDDTSASQAAKSLKHKTFRYFGVFSLTSHDGELGS